MAAPNTDAWPTRERRLETQAALAEKLADIVDSLPSKAAAKVTIDRR